MIYIIAGTLLVLIIGIISAVIKFLQKKKEIKAGREFDYYTPLINEYFIGLEQLGTKYILKKEAVEFNEKWKSLLDELKHIHIGIHHPLYETYTKFYRAYDNIFSTVEELNNKYIEQKSIEYNDLLSNIDGKSLDIQQRTVVISSDERTLVLAGAGSGKTLTIAAKVKYLTEVENINPKDILLISFTNKSAEEMTARINNKLGINVNASTFHKLGLEIIKASKNFRPDVFDDLNGFIHDFFEKDILNHPKLVEKLTEYFTYYLEIPEDMENCSSLGELYEMEKSADLETLKSKYDKEKYIESVKKEKSLGLITLNGEKVKSLEEIKIANFLFMHGIKYEYESEYPYESDDPMRKSYRPDFFLPDYNIYIEHFGITRDYKCPWLSEVEEAKYIDGINWKRDFHKKNNTKLLETYSYNMKEGNIFEVLTQMLQDNGVQFREKDFNDIYETIYAKKSNKYFSEFIKLCCTFITLFKSNNYRIDKISEMKEQAYGLNNMFKYKRTELFLDIIYTLLTEYEKYLTDNSSIDFSDMINCAADEIKNGFKIPEYKYVIVDEYQDISLSRFNLLKAVVDYSGAKLLCVGDDWQSIYRFAGSDVSLFTNFENYLGYTKILKIEKTYRNSQQLINEASNFILKNPLQLEKKLRSDKSLSYPLVFWGYDSNPGKTLDLIVQKIIQDFGTEKSILFLGRTNYDIEILKESNLFTFHRVNGEEVIKYNSSPETPVYFLSVHKSKGLEADNVVLLNFKNDRLGFPNQIADDELLNLVLTREDNFQFAEERRLFYVAITRTKNRTFILTDNKIPSIFMREFDASESVCFISITARNSKAVTNCPRCKTGELLKIQNGGEFFVGCTNFPKCRYKLRDATILISPKKCPACGGFLIKRHGKNYHSFSGCTNFPYCQYTEEIIKNR